MPSPPRTPASPRRSPKITHSRRPSLLSIGVAKAIPSEQRSVIIDNGVQIVVVPAGDPFYRTSVRTSASALRSTPRRPGYVRPLPFSCEALASPTSSLRSSDIQSTSTCPISPLSLPPPRTLLLTPPSSTLSIASSPKLRVISPPVALKKRGTPLSPVSPLKDSANLFNMQPKTSVRSAPLQVS
ncbi:hypothetical protein FISHEDRAFT_75970 [Fistulina hepatica ATCC 64428]|uniref:Uncharacterized protein n=1 Tax=Fistulina hepatica ATCC 64428 TaxID=1128425 RepID=A0A0D7A520_9AGAR|nr:hypothetical protein FISHEDRAFT_75970 [Fistulina hepatica ATCC 64428]